VIAGGKYTTYRVMAADVVDAAVAQLDSSTREEPIPESSTADIPLVGADGYAAMWAERGGLAREAGLSTEAMETLLRRHGDRVTEVFEVMRTDPRLAEPLIEGAPYLKAEVVVGATHQGACDLDDVLTRRLRVALEVPDHGEAAARAAAPLVAEVLGWSPQETSEQLQRYCAHVDMPG